MASHHEQIKKERNNIKPVVEVREKSIWQKMLRLWEHHVTHHQTPTEQVLSHLPIKSRILILQKNLLPIRRRG